MNTTTLQIRIDEKTKNETKKIFGDLKKVVKRYRDLKFLGGGLLSNQYNYYYQC